MNGSDFDWTLMQSFLAVADTGSYSAAARRTGRSQPTIGRHVEALQAQLGATLFQRGAQGYELTETGAALMDHARAMAEAAAKVSLIAAGRSEELRGTVRLTASEIVATYVLPELLAELLDVEPGLQIELVASNETSNLLRREADIAVRMVEPVQQDLVARRVGAVALGIFAAPSYAERHGLPQDARDLLNYRLLGYDRSDLILRGMAAYGLPVERESFAFRCDDQVTYMEALKAGLGIGFAQARQAEEAGLIRVLPQVDVPPLPVWLAAHAELRTSARVRRVFDHLAERLPAALGG